MYSTEHGHPMVSHSFYYPFICLLVGNHFRTCPIVCDLFARCPIRFRVWVLYERVKRDGLSAPLVHVSRINTLPFPFDRNHFPTISWPFVRVCSFGRVTSELPSADWWTSTMVRRAFSLDHTSGYTLCYCSSWVRNYEFRWHNTREGLLTKLKQDWKATSLDNMRKRSLVSDWPRWTIVWAVTIVIKPGSSRVAITKFEGLISLPVHSSLCIFYWWSSYRAPQLKLSRLIV